MAMIICPECKEEDGELIISAHTYGRVYWDETDGPQVIDSWDFDFDDESQATCGICDYVGRVGDFLPKNITIEEA